ncbi:MAG TPA: transposase [Bryobacteraceae bacterium]|nr:transposase [Bryobacteraceae bacterium]
MARLARVVAPGCWHHLTQRGNRRQTVFFSDAGRALYLQLMSSHLRRESVAISGYCPMGNHVHLIVIPNSEAGLARALGRTHCEYSCESWRRTWGGRLRPQKRGPKVKPESALTQLNLVVS